MTFQWASLYGSLDTPAITVRSSGSLNFTKMKQTRISGI